MIKVLHAFIWFSISKGGGTCDLMYKLAKAQEKRDDLKPMIYSSNEYFDQNLKNNLKNTVFILSNKLINLFSLNLNSPSFKKFLLISLILFICIYTGRYKMFFYIFTTL